MAREIDILFDPDRQAIVQDFEYLSGGTDFLQARLPKFMLGDDYRINLWAPATFDGWTTATGRAGISIPEPGGAVTAGTWFFRYVDSQTSGSLFSGSRYKIVTYAAGDDFTNVGGVNQTGSVFGATGTTPTTWTNGSVVQMVSADLSYAATAAQVQTALNAMLNPGVTFTVTGEAGGPWVILAGVTDILSAFLVEDGNLYPQSNGQVLPIQQGDGLNKYEQFRVELKQAVSASTTSFTNIAAPNVSNVVTNPQNGGAGLNELFVVELPNFPYAGSFTLASNGNSTIPLGYAADPADMVAALEGVAEFGANNVDVRQTGDYKWEIEAIGGKANTAIANLTASITGLTFAVGRYVDLPLNTNNMVAALDGRSSRPMSFELELTISSKVQTPVHEGCTVINDNFDPASTTSTPTDTPVTDSDLGTLTPALRLDITDFTGGAATDMDGIPAADLATGYVIITVIGGVLRLHQLQVSAAAEAAPGIIEPDDDSSRRWISML